MSEKETTALESDSRTTAIDISVVVVTYNSSGCIEECVRSLQHQQCVRSEIIVVDNLSPDSTVAVVRKMGSTVRLFANTENIGFGRGCNQGFEASRGRFVYFMNPDARLEQADGLAQMVRAMEKNLRWGLAGTRVVTEDGRVEEPETSYPDQERVHSDFSKLPGKIAWVFGASMIVRREIFQSLKGFDPGFFLSSEETDLCLRIRQQGWEIGNIPEVSIRHIGQASERGNDPYVTYLRRMTGMLRFRGKHYTDEDARRLARRDLLRSSFRREWYRLTSSFSGRSSTAWQKHRKYAGVSEASRLYLEKGLSDSKASCPACQCSRGM